MDKNHYDERVKRLREVNGVVAKLDPAIRADAFSLLKSYITGEKGATEHSAGGHSRDKHEEDPPGDVGMAEFFEKIKEGEPHDNARAVAAFHYSQFGAEPFSTDEVRQIANEAGLTLPRRLDMTYGAAKEGGRSLFLRSGRGKFGPTVHGEKFFKETYSAKKGKKKKAEATE